MSTRSAALWLVCLGGLAGATAPAASGQDDGGLPAKVDDLMKRIEALEKGQNEQTEDRERLRRELEGAVRALESLRERAILLEKAEEIKRVPEYVCPNGHIYAAPSADTRCPDCREPQEERLSFKKVKLSRREAISEKIEAALAEAEKRRVFVGLSGTMVVQQILHNESPQTPNQAYAAGSLDLFFAARPLPHAVFLVDLQGGSGDGPDALVGSPSILNGDAANLQDDDGVDRVEVREVWLETQFFDQRLRLAAGKIDLTNYFDGNTIANDETTQFLTGAFVNNLELAQPPNGPGAAAVYDTRSGFILGAGFQSPDNAGDTLFETPYVIGEVAYRDPALLLGRTGTWRVWGKRDNGTDKDDVAVGVSADQEITSSLTAFARYGWGFRQKVEDSFAVSAGAELRNLWESRSRDRLGVAIGYHRPTFAPPAFTPPLLLGRDVVFEVYYAFFINEHFRVSPIGQGLVHTTGDGTLPDQENVYLLGVRAQVDF